MLVAAQCVIGKVRASVQTVRRMNICGGEADTESILHMVWILVRTLPITYCAATRIKWQF